MKAIYLEAINSPFVLIDKEKPVAGPGEAIVQVKSAALNHRDVYIQYGRYFTKEYPTILGSDGAGIVTEVGEGVDKSWIGKEVIIDPSTDWGDDLRAHGKNYKVLGMPEDGAFAEFVKVRATNLHEKPEHLSWEEAAALPLAGVTAYRAMFTKCGLKAGERVLITGAGGGVALFAVQFAVAAGAEVWVTSGSDEKIEAAKKLGATGGINYKNENWGKELKTIVGGFDVAIDGAAGEGFVQLVKLAKSGGRIGMYGGTTGMIGQINPAEIFWKQLAIHGSTMGTNQDFAEMVAFVRDKKIKPIVDSIFPLEKTEEAMRYMEAGKQFGKIVVSVS
ncbi:zinc-binding dehydrogenase [Pontibacter sp. BT310]|uniref:Zinc-binding dehydrogenase n=1 Tax=Pontibacter populi TaxID=890055 RepID=A0ABS6X6N5_9BACT|nr:MULTISPECIES: zinc-binding dehydrogenase [Pontibacter]MBJ6116808.1 zinc-binding dehydrogenase [Pontibacter sp. BT310]MBR0569230.1 zinc-binding dehydrogenase [Microvirga sp. STS03]MBW3363661.1 zinc-binding dehydrogenase [Pontibacter populi]